MKKLVAAVAAGVVLVAAGFALAQQADAAAEPAYHPTRLAHVGSARQMVVVAGDSRTSTYATLRTYELNAEGTWFEKFPAMRARSGYGGWVPSGQRVQDTGTTPRGTFYLTEAYGSQANPGAKLKYRRFDSNDYWAGDQKDPKTYNLYQTSASAKRTWRTGEAERLAAYPTQYEYFLVIDFNRPAVSTVKWDTTRTQYYTTSPVNTKLGNAIFLHVNGSGSTAGCVSLARADLLKVLTWLDPAKKPRITMAPLSELGSA